MLSKIAGAGLGSQRYAVIIDEAHSSQGRDAATRLKPSLAVNVAPMEGSEGPAGYMSGCTGPSQIFRTS